MTQEEIQNKLKKYLNHFLETSAFTCACIIKSKSDSYTYELFIPSIDENLYFRDPKKIQAAYNLLETLFSLANIHYKLQVHPVRCDKYIITINRNSTSIKKLELICNIGDIIYYNYWSKDCTLTYTKETLGFTYNPDILQELLSVFPDLQYDNKYVYITKNKINSLRRHFNQSLALCKIQGYTLPDYMLVSK